MLKKNIILPLNNIKIKKNIANKSTIDFKIYIYILCYNEEILLTNTINHYRKYLPNCIITIYDNQSTDNSVKIAKKLNCNVITFNTNNKNNPLIKRDIFNNCWKNSDADWVIVADMDEWLCITREDLFNEYKNNVTILSVKGYDMIGESKKSDLSDIDLHKINKCIVNIPESKNICFYKPKIIEMNYTPGHHTCKPIGYIKYSNKTYILKHMSILGLEYLINKNFQRYKRSRDARKNGMSTHYTDDINRITKMYNNKLKKCNYLF